VIGVIGRLASPVVGMILGLPEEATAALVVGFLRKDVAVGMLAPLHMGLKQTIVACVVISMYIPCVATFAVMLREMGMRDTAKSIAIIVGSAFATGGFINFLLRVAGQ
jgi:ferrous iron transport protein B